MLTFFRFTASHRIARQTIVTNFTHCQNFSAQIQYIIGTSTGALIAVCLANGISIDGEISEWYRDDISLRCKAYNWNVIDNVNGHDAKAIDAAIIAAKQSDKPTMIVCKTSIGYGAGDKQDNASSHGAALGEKHLSQLRRNLGWEHEPFNIPQEVYKDWDAKERGKELEKEWEKNLCSP